MMDEVDVYLGLGTNLGDREANLQKALAFLDEAFGTRYSSLSGFHETKPWGFESSERFLNAAVKYVLSICAFCSSWNISISIFQAYSGYMQKCRTHNGPHRSS